MAFSPALSRRVYRLSFGLAVLLVVPACLDGTSEDDADAGDVRIDRDAGGGGTSDSGGSTGSDAGGTGADTGNGGGGSDAGTVEDTGPVDTWPADWRALEEEVLDLINEERAQGANCGGEIYGAAGPLEMDELLRQAARGHSQDMAEQGFFDHVSPDGREFMDRVYATGYNGGGPWGENIAAGYPTAQEVVDGWMDSPGHCTNIMEPSYGVVGVGLFYSDTAEYGAYWTQNFGGTH